MTCSRTWTGSSVCILSQTVSPDPEPSSQCLVCCWNRSLPCPYSILLPHLAQRRLDNSQSICHNFCLSCPPRASFVWNASPFLKIQFAGEPDGSDVVRIIAGQKFILYIELFVAQALLAPTKVKQYCILNVLPRFRSSVLMITNN